MKFKQAYKKRTDMKDAMSAVPYGDRNATINAIVGAIKQGGLFAAARICRVSAQITGKPASARTL